MRYELTLRPASEVDADFLRSLRNEPAVVAASRTNEPVDETTHRKWLAESIESSTRRLFVVCDADVPVGQARLDVAHDGEWVSIAFVPQQRGRGHGIEVLNALQRVAHGDLLAEIRTNNHASRRLFERAGFEELSVDDGFAKLRWSKPADRHGQTQRTTVGMGRHAD